MCLSVYPRSHSNSIASGSETLNPPRSRARPTSHACRIAGFSRRFARDWKRTSRKRPKRFHVGRGLFLGCMEPINILWKVFRDNKLKPGSSLSSRDSQYILGLPPFLPPPPPSSTDPGLPLGFVTTCEECRVTAVWAAESCFPQRRLTRAG